MNTSTLDTTAQHKDLRHPQSFILKIVIDLPPQAASAVAAVAAVAAVGGEVAEVRNRFDIMCMLFIRYIVVAKSGDDNPRFSLNCVITPTDHTKTPQSGPTPPTTDHTRCRRRQHSGRWSAFGTRMTPDDQASNRESRLRQYAAPAHTCHPMPRCS